MIYDSGKAPSVTVFSQNFRNQFYNQYVKLVLFTFKLNMAYRDVMTLETRFRAFQTILKKPIRIQNYEDSFLRLFECKGLEAQEVCLFPVE